MLIVDRRWCYWCIHRGHFPNSIISPSGGCWIDLAGADFFAHTFIRHIIFQSYLVRNCIPEALSHCNMVRDIKKKGGGEREIADRCFRRKNSGSQGEQATDPHLKNHRWREREGGKWKMCVEWEASMTQPSRKISTGKSIWEWVRLALTPNVQPVMSWEESSWQRIRILEMHIHKRQGERNTFKHTLKRHTHRDANTPKYAETNLLNARAAGLQKVCVSQGGSYAHSNQCWASAVSATHTHASPAINKLPQSTHFRRNTLLSDPAARSRRSKEAIGGKNEHSSGSDRERGWEALCCRKSVNVSVCKLQVTDWLIHVPSTSCMTIPWSQTQTHLMILELFASLARFNQKSDSLAHAMLIPPRIG